MDPDEKTGNIGEKTVTQGTHSSGKAVVGGRTALDGIHTDAVGESGQQMDDHTGQSVGCNGNSFGQEGTPNQNVSAQHKQSEQKQNGGDFKLRDLGGQLSDQQLYSKREKCRDSQEKTDVAVGETKITQNISGETEKNGVKTPSCDLKECVWKGCRHCRAGVTDHTKAHIGKPLYFENTF